MGRPFENKSNVHHLCIHSDIHNGGNSYTIDHLLGIVGEKFYFNLCLENNSLNCFSRPGTITLTETTVIPQQMGSIYGQNRMNVNYVNSQMSMNNMGGAPYPPTAGTDITS